MQVVVKPPDRDVMLIDETALGLIDGIILEPLGLIPMTVEGRFMGNDEINAASDSLLDDFGGGQEGSRNRLHSLSWIAGLEGVDRVCEGSAGYSCNDGVDYILNSS